MSGRDREPLWREDLADLPAETLRPARYALSFFKSEPRFAKHLQARELLAALWQLTRPLLAPSAVARLAPDFAECVEAWDAVIQPDSEPIDVAALETALRRGLDGQPDEGRPAEEVLRERLMAFFAQLPRRCLTSLAAADGETPVSRTIALLGDALGLDATSLAVLDFLHQRGQSPALQMVLAANGRASAQVNRARLAALLGREVRALRAALDKGRTAACPRPARAPCGACRGPGRLSRPRRPARDGTRGRPRGQ
jgi:hypothetical protein